MESLKLTIDTPCHENWQAMHPNEQGRFCNACAKTVVDFTSMSDDELLKWFQKPSDQKVCGRMFTGQLDRVITPQPKPKRWALKYAAAAMLFLSTQSQSATAQSKPKKTVKPHASYRPMVVGEIAVRPMEPRKIHIVDNDLQPVPGASVIFSGGSGLQADSAGIFALRNNADSITVSAIGFKTDTIPVSSIMNDTIRLEKDSAKLEPVVIIDSQLLCDRVFMGEVVISAVQVRQPAIPLIKAKNSFSVTVVSPNPVNPGQNMRIRFKTDDQPALMEVFNSTGQPLMKMPVQAKIKSLDVAVPAHWSRGEYFLKLYNKAGRPIGTEKFLVL